MKLLGADGQEYLLQRGTNILGRGQGSHVHLTDPGVSRQHAQIEWAGESLTIVDLGSANGTFVNEQRVTAAHSLQPGDRIRVGSSMVLALANAGHRPQVSSMAEVAGMILVGTDGQQYDLQPGTSTLGRDASNQVVIAASQVSRQHAEIRWSGDNITISDLGSTNGTFVNDQPVTTAHPLRLGDRIRLGSGAILTLQALPEALVSAPVGEVSAARSLPVVPMAVGGGLALLVAILLFFGLKNRTVPDGGSRFSIPGIAPQAQSAQEPPAEGLVATSTAAPTSTAPPFAPNAPSASAGTPLATASVTKPTAAVYTAPVLVAPADGTHTSVSPLRFEWQWAGQLQPDEHFDLRIWQEGQPHEGKAWAETTSHELGLTGWAPGKYYWTVVVIRGTKGELEAELSAESEPWVFYWDEPVGPGAKPTPEFRP